MTYAQYKIHPHPVHPMLTAIQSHNFIAFLSQHKLCNCLIKNVSIKIYIAVPKDSIGCEWINIHLSHSNSYSTWTYLVMFQLARRYLYVQFSQYSITTYASHTMRESKSKTMRQTKCRVSNKKREWIKYGKLFFSTKALKGHDELMTWWDLIQSLFRLGLLFKNSFLKVVK